jgi:hypothetical protein
LARLEQVDQRKCRSERNTQRAQVLDRCFRLPFSQLFSGRSNVRQNLSRLAGNLLPHPGGPTKITVQEQEPAKQGSRSIVQLEVTRTSR